MNKKGLFALMGMLAVAACIAVSVLAQPTPIANVTTANEETIIFDTGPSSNPYPSIAGTHKGTITPAKTLNVSKIFTYPCKGTGGHSKYVQIHGNGVNETATWGGYSEEWYKLSFGQSFLLVANKTYYYEIKTGSYPQIHHRDELEVEGGTINCTSFVDANGRSHDNWIPAIRLEGYFVDGEGVHNQNTGENFSTIQAAIDDNETQDGHTIVVYAGTYKENVVVTKRLTLRGIGMPIVDANGPESAISVNADGCVVDGFNVTGASSGSEFDFFPGIIVTSDGTTLVNNTATNNGCGILLPESSNNTLINNIVDSNNHGILLWYGSSYNTLTNNIVSNNYYVGILVCFSQGNIITNNTVSSNRGNGIIFDLGSKNRIYHNNFVDNTNQAREVRQGGLYPSNSWHNGSIEGGNYWSDHVCTGNPSDGSQPYTISGISQDRYPFEDPWGWVRNES